MVEDGRTADGMVESDVVPAAVVRATCEMARELLIVDRTAAAPGEGISATQTSQATHDGTERVEQHVEHDLQQGGHAEDYLAGCAGDAGEVWGAGERGERGGEAGENVIAACKRC